jgi:hypothetical protein
MSDIDVQTARDFVDAKKAESQELAKGYLPKILARESHNAVEEAAKKRKAMSKEDRLGLK